MSSSLIGQSLIGGGNGVRRNSRDNTYLFVDGGHLRQRVQAFEQYFFSAPLTMVYERLSGSAHKSFYYDAYPEKKTTETESEFRIRYDAAEQRFAEIASNRGWHVNFGLTRGEGKKLRQKGVDVKLALDALAHRSRGNFERIILLTSDLDFLPLVRALVEAGAWVELWCDPTIAPKELINASDSRRFIEPRGFREYVFGGSKLTLPEWNDIPYEHVREGTVRERRNHSKGWASLSVDETGPLALRIRSDLQKASIMRDASLERLEALFRYDMWYATRQDI